MIEWNTLKSDLDTIANVSNAGSSLELITIWKCFPDSLLALVLKPTDSDFLLCVPYRINFLRSSLQEGREYAPKFDGIYYDDFVYAQMPDGTKKLLEFWSAPTMFFKPD